MNADLVLAGLVLAAAVNISRRERWSGIALVLVVHAMHRAVFGDVDSALLYYLSAATVDAFTAVALYRFRTESPFYFHMAEAFAVSMAMNILGYVAYMSYLAPSYYNVAMLITAAMQALIMVTDDGFWRRTGRAAVALFHAVVGRAGALGTQLPEKTN